MDGRWTVGELARVGGVTIRTLRHYDALGLLIPHDRTAAGYRLYDRGDLARLYRIRVLRQLGMPLADIRAVLDGDGEVRAIMARHRDVIRRQIAQLETLAARLERALDAETDASRELIEIMEAMTMIDKYYTDEQQAQLAARRNELGEDRIRHAERAWAELITAMDHERTKGTPPADPRVQELAARWRDLIEQFTGGDEGIRRSLQTMYEQEGSDIASRGMVSPELMAYVGEALRVGE